MSGSDPNLMTQPGGGTRYSSSAPPRLSTGQAGYTLSPIRPGSTSVEVRKYQKRANGPQYYSQTDETVHRQLPNKAPVPGYTGYIRGMNMDFGVSKAFGLPIELMEIPKTPDAFHRDLEDLLGQGFGPQGKHKLGMQSHYAGKAYGDKYKMKEALRIQRITGVGKEAPFDFVPGDGLVQECHIHTDGLYHRFPSINAKVAYMPDTTNGARIRRPKGMANKGFAPPKIILPAGSVGTVKYSLFNLPTTLEVANRKMKYTRV